MSSRPPKWMMRFFRWYCRKDMADAIEGDLLEVYQRRFAVQGRFKANYLFLWNVINFFQPFAFRREHEQYSQLNSIHMFYNYLKIGIRFLNKHRSFSAINILGLAVGISAFVLMGLFILDEFSYDKFHEKGDRIIRVGYQLETPNSTRLGAKVPFPMKAKLLDNYPEVERVALLYHSKFDLAVLQHEDNQFTESDIYFTETDFFRIFDFKLKQGNPETALNDAKSIILTQAMVTKYFGNEDPMGKIMRYKNEDDLIVTGILEDHPETSHVNFDFLVPIELQRQRWMGWGKFTYDLKTDWNWAGAWVYPLLSPGVDLESFTAKIQAIADEHFNTGSEEGYSLVTQRLWDIHLKSDMSSEASANGNITQVYTFGIVAVLILLIACINFINLSTAQATRRAKEIGLRKVMGALRKQLIGQFIAESVLVVTTSIGIAMILVLLTLPVFNEFTNKNLGFENLNNVLVIVGFAVAMVLIALISGSYPAFRMSRIKPVNSLKSGFSSIGSKRRFNRALVIGQLIVSNLLIIGILVVNNQLDFIQNKDLGFDKESVIVIEHGKNITDQQFELLETSLSGNPAVKGVSQGYVAGTSTYTNTFKKVADQNSPTFVFGVKRISKEFLNVYDLDVIEGRNFDDITAGDLNRKNLIINAAAAKALCWEVSESIGKRLSYLAGGNKSEDTVRIIGVMEDANFESLYDPIMPSVFRYVTNGDISIKLQGQQSSNLLATIETIEESWNEIVPELPFEYEFLDQQISAQYVKEERLGSAIKYFTVLAIFVACLGLFGLVSFSVQQRTKEIGVRKVLGASVATILGLVTKNFLVLTGVSFILSAPIGYFLANQWLADFAFRIELSPWIFIVAGLASALIAMLSIGGQSIKAAVADPVKTLRYE